MSLESFAPDVDIEKELAAEAETTQPAPEAEVTAEPKAEAPKEAPKEDKERLVPHGALHEERMRRKEAQARAEQIERESQERFKKLEERLAKLSEAAAPKVPSFQEDPANHLKHEVESLKPVAQEVEQIKKQYQEQAAVQEMARRVTAAESEFMREKTDYPDAVTYLKGVVDRNLQLLGVEDPAQRLQAVDEQAANLAKTALQAGKNPAQVAYELARNYGYQAKKTEPDLEKKIETIEKGQKLPSMPSGGKKETALSLAALEQMDDDEFNKLIDDDAQWKKLIRQ